VTITSADNRTLSNSLNISTTCGSPSSVTLAVQSAQTVTVTPGGTCAASGGGGSSGGGGGDLIVGSGPLAPGYVNTHSTGATTTPSLPASFTQSPTTTVLVALPATTTPGIIIFRNYQIWDRSEDIRALQKWFNQAGYPVAASGPGSPGNETSIFGTHTYQSLIKFQSAHGLPATGYLGPLTRAAINSL
jgi:Putative peptidoglycan binding domain